MIDKIFAALMIFVGILTGIVGLRVMCDAVRISAGGEVGEGIVIGFFALVLIIAAGFAGRLGYKEIHH